MRHGGKARRKDEMSAGFVQRRGSERRVQAALAQSRDHFSLLARVNWCTGTLREARLVEMQVCIEELEQSQTCLSA